MSASVDQGSKNQQVQAGTNGPAPGKESVKDLDYDNYMRQHHQAASMSNPERYVQPNFYALPGFPYFGDPAWSSGGDPLAYLGYQQPNSEYMPGNPMLNPFDYSHGGLAWSSFPPAAADFVWGAAASNGRKEVHGGDAAPVYDYYAVSPTHMYPAAHNGDMDMEMRALEHGLQAVGVSDESELSHERGGGHVVSVSDGGSEMRGMISGDQASAAGPAGSLSTTNCAAAAAPLPAVKKPMSWASVASQPAKSPHQPQMLVQQQQQPHPRANRHAVAVQAPMVNSSSAAAVGDASSWDKDDAAGVDAGKGGRQPSGHVRHAPQLLQQQAAAWSVPRAARGAGQSTVSNSDPGISISDSAASAGGSASACNVVAPPAHPVLEKLKSTNMYNPANFDLNPKNPRFFIIKSYSEDDIHRSIKYNIWCSTDHGNKRLDAAYQERAGRGPVFLFFSVNGSGHFCGMAQMVSPVDYNSHSGVWTQDKWKGQFEVKWIYVKDVPNGQLRHIRLENNENKPVTNSRDTQEVPPEKGKQVLKIMHSFRHTTSIFDDFGHYEKKQEEDESKKRALPACDY